MLRIGRVSLESPLLLAPIAGYCDLAFRLVVRSIRGAHGGVGLASTDLLCPQAVLREKDQSLWLAATCSEDRPLCMQLYGAEAAVMADAARWAQDHGAAVIDINMGCPVDKVTKKNGGSMLLCDLDKARHIAATLVKAVAIPVTAKIRLGWDEQRIVGPTLAPALADLGVAAITVHGRTTEQMFRGQVRLEGIARVVEAVRPRFPRVPVIGNGDVRSPHDAAAMMAATGCQGVMIGRGALGQPWIFRDTAHLLATGALPPPLPRSQRARIVLEHFETLLRLRQEHHVELAARRASAADPDAALRPLDPREPQRVALAMIRARMSWYSAHLQPWPNLRRQVQALTSVEQFRDFMARGIERLAAEDANPGAAPGEGPPTTTAQAAEVGAEATIPGPAFGPM